MNWSQKRSIYLTLFDMRDNFITNVYQDEEYFVPVACYLDSSMGMLYYCNRNGRALKEVFVI